MATMANNVQMQGVYVNVPAVDWSLFRELIRRFGWQAETREQLLVRIVAGLTPAFRRAAMMMLILVMFFTAQTAGLIY